jgi:glycosyltransferase involved in cell wall biosynthesis
MIDGRKMTFATFFPECQNVHLIKDVGMIPYILERDSGYESYIITYNNDEYMHLDGAAKGLKMLFLKKNLLSPVEDFFIRGKGRNGFPENWLLDKVKALFSALDLGRLLRKQAGDFDVFQVYHFRYESILAGLLYRLFNRHGILYMKLDINPVVLKQYQDNPGKMENPFSLSYALFKLASFDIVSVESEKLCDFLKNNHPLFKHCKMLYLQNGIDIAGMPVPSCPGQKENIVLHVARMGDPDKGSDNVLEVFQRTASDFPEWTLVLIGSMTEQFAGLYQQFLRKNPGINDRIIYLGLVNDRETIYRYYDRAKILLMPSRRESFGIAAIEACYYGDIIVGSDIPALRTITDEGRLGYLCPTDDLGCLEKRLRKIMSGENSLNNMSTSINMRIRDKYDWVDICRRLDNVIREDQNSLQPDPVESAGRIKT